MENIDIDINKAILQNIDIDKISNRFKFGISNRAIQNSFELLTMYISDRYRVDIEGLVVAHGDHLVALLVVLHAPNLVGPEVSLMKIGKMYEKRKP